MQIINSLFSKNIKVFDHYLEASIFNLGLLHFLIIKKKN